MTKHELLEILKNPENSGIQYKCDIVENFKLAKELVAFANLRGSWMPNCAKSVAQGCDAGLWLSGAHGPGDSQKDHQGHAGT